MSYVCLCLLFQRKMVVLRLEESKVAITEEVGYPGNWASHRPVEGTKTTPNEGAPLTQTTSKLTDSATPKCQTDSHLLRVKARRKKGRDAQNSHVCGGAYRFYLMHHDQLLK